MVLQVNGKCECGGHLVDGTCTSCGLVEDKHYMYPSFDIRHGRTPFYPAGGLSVNGESFSSKYKYRVYTGKHLIKKATRELYLPKNLSIGAMNRFLKLTRGPNLEHTFAETAAIAVLLEAESWDFPLFKREVCKIFDLEESRFRRVLREKLIKLKPMNKLKIAWKFKCEHDISMDDYSKITSWIRRGRDHSNNAIVAAAILLATSHDIRYLSSWFSVPMTWIYRVIDGIKRRYTL